MKKIAVLALSLVWAVCPLMAQNEEKSEEEKLAADYFSALYGDKDTVRAEFLKSELLEKYPRGAFARRLSAESVNGAADSVEYMARCDAFRRDFPISGWLEAPDGSGFVYMNFYRSYSQFLYQKGLWDKLRQVLPEMTYSMLADLYSHGPMYLIMKAPIDPKEYVDISEDIIRNMWEKKDCNPDMYGGGKIMPADGSMDYYLAVETEILQRSGRPAEAVECMGRADAAVRYNQYADGNESYIKALEELGRHDDAVTALLGATAVGRLTPELFSMLRNHYNSLDEKPAGTFDAYYESLKTETARENLRNDVMAGMVDVPYENFSLTSIGGKKVESAGFGPDDIVVLDFWATWCAPCIAALEGMQLAVDKYADDRNVHFYFICTQDEPDRKRVRNVWKRGGYRNMTVLFDENREGSEGHDKVYRSIIKGTSGIPQKAVLKDGRIRYIAEGYGGSPSGLMDEISAVIEILKAE